MFIAISPYKNPLKNLALEEMLFSEMEEEGILLWRNDRSIILGRNQNMMKEIIPEACKKYGCQVLRRNTGGGAVYHDLGNINYSVFYRIKEKASIQEKDMEESFLQVLFDYLKSQGLRAVCSGRNDILIKDRKISGTARLERGTRGLFHGTLLYDVDMEILKNVLRVSTEKLSANGIDSVRSRVENIKNLLEKKHISMETFDGEKTAPPTTAYWMRQFYDYLIDHLHCQPWVITKEIKEKAEVYRKEKYGNPEWNIGRNDKFSYAVCRRFSCGEICIEFDVDHFVIKKCRITGDFVGERPVSELEKQLIGISYKEDSVRNCLEKQNLKEFFCFSDKGNMDKKEFLVMIMEPMKEEERNEN